MTKMRWNESCGFLSCAPGRGGAAALCFVFAPGRARAVPKASAGQRQPSAKVEMKQVRNEACWLARGRCRLTLEKRGGGWWQSEAENPRARLQNHDAGGKREAVEADLR